jgi:hypothetical protein
MLKLERSFFEMNTNKYMIFFVLLFILVWGLIGCSSNLQSTTTSTPAATLSDPTPSPSPVPSLAPTGAPTPTPVTKSITSSKSNKSIAITANMCRKDFLAGVYKPTRFKIIRNCTTITGTVEKVVQEKSGGYQVSLKPDKEFSKLINDHNDKLLNGNLLVEIIPLDIKKVGTVKKGDHITATGAYVLNKKQGWFEIHPAWIVNGKGSINYTENEAKKSATLKD